MPSNWWQTCATAGALSSVTVKLGNTITARSTKSRTDSYCVSACQLLLLGQDRETRAMEQGKIFRPQHSRPSQLVARTHTFGQACNKDLANSAQASIRCSQLSNISNILLPRKWSVKVFMIGRPGFSSTPNTAATVCGTSAGISQWSEFNQPHAITKIIEQAGSDFKARRVLPHPP